MPDPFATADEMARFTNTPLPSDLARIQQLLALASAEIRGFVGQTLSAVQGDIITLGPTSKRSLYLPERPVTAIPYVSVAGVAVTAYSFTPDGQIVHGLTPADYSLESWPDGATVTYDHGYAEYSTEYDRIKTICIQAALRAYTMNERGQSETLGGPEGLNVMESAGYAPDIFLTPSEKTRLMDFEPVGVG